jgi:hypothetical protein
MFENRMLGRILGPKRDEVMGGRRKLHKEEVHDLYLSPSIIRIMKIVYRLLVGKPERKRPLGRPRHRSLSNIKMDLEETG